VLLDEAARKSGEGCSPIPTLGSVGFRCPKVLSDAALTNAAARFFWPGLRKPGTFGSGGMRGCLVGRPLDWDLQREVALIKNEDWKKGPEHIARLIKDIEARFLATSSLWQKTSSSTRRPGCSGPSHAHRRSLNLLAATLEQVGDALDDALANPSNGLTERSRETRVIRRALTRYGNDPQQIEMSMVSVHRSITRQIVEHELPPSEENIALQEAVAAARRPGWTRAGP
jgi:hypothetical protein